MKEKYEGQGLERFGWTLVVFAVIGALSVMGGVVWGVWKWLT